jgi:hypothetical protein
LFLLFCNQKSSRKVPLRRRGGLWPTPAVCSEVGLGTVAASRLYLGRYYVGQGIRTYSHVYCFRFAECAPSRDQ